MFEPLYQDLERSSDVPLGCYVSFRERIRERLVAGAVGILIGLAAGAVMLMLGAAS